MVDDVVHNLVVLHSLICSEAPIPLLSISVIILPSHPQYHVSYLSLTYILFSFQMSSFEENMCVGITVHTPTPHFLWNDDSLFQMLALPQVSDEHELELEYEGVNYKRWVMMVR